MSDPNAGLAGLAPETVDGVPFGGGADPVGSGAGGGWGGSGGNAWGGADERPASLRHHAFQELLRRPLFWVAVVLIALVVAMAVAPGLFTRVSPTACDLARSRQQPGAGAPFGYDLQGCDVYARTVHGARASIVVGVMATVLTLLIGVVSGLLAGYHGGWWDTVISRVTDVFFAIPVLLGAILLLTAFPRDGDSAAQLTAVVLALTVLGWTGITRIMRASVIQVRDAEFVVAARALGASDAHILRRHVLPNSLTPVIVVATIALGGFVGAEATLSFLGIGLEAPIISWGQMIDSAAPYVRVSPHMLFFPALFLSLTVLAFVILGDVLRDAFDPRLR